MAVRMITPNLLSFQWNGYPRAHGARVNLAIHAVSNALFFAVLIAAPFTTAWLLLAIPLVFLAQGIGHKSEANPPEPFRSPLDIVARLIVEQLITFPRFVVSGGFGRAWRA